ncbi:major capsid protein [uncultured phage_MedDCM-OCT-S45-C4]|uniref:Major capsid protein n=1 Tax=uncultured phage_MedDCM-OCT-S45-C4 TaxID=2740801 RepID=A0A6S4P9F1_9CAUD|nr:major head protein [uncultured phage_MedDCM-OCT-S45-C4]BAQ93975.1 major capsid protein [uncultured phage_MedDCM-OCT-S45-C4]
MAQQSTAAPTSLTRAGQRNAAGDARALYLKLFSGEMFKGFEYNAIARDLVMKRTLTGGRSMQFIYTGRTTAEYHTPGNAILGNSDGAPPVAEKTITVDDLLISSAFVYDLDETLSHYDLRSEISKKIGYALAQKYDRLIFRAVARGARAKSPVQKTSFIEPGGTQIRVGSTTNASDAYNSANLISAFYDAAAALDEKGVSSDGRVGVLNPRQYYELIQAIGSNGLVNRDAQGSALQGGNGIIEIAGIKIYKSMNIPFFGNYGTKYGTGSATNPGVTDPGNSGDFVGEAMEDAENSDTGINNEYGEGGAGATGDFKNSCGLIFQKEAAGCVEAIGPQVQVTSGDVSVVYQGDVILGRMAMGADYLNPAAAVELFAGTATAPAQFGTVQTSSNNAGYGG